MTENDMEIYQKGVAYLEEWEDVNYCEHTFKFKDEWLTDREVVDLLNALHEENEDLLTKKEDAEYELLHLKEKYEKLIEEKEKYKKEMLYFKRELQKELVCEAIINGGKINENK